MVRKHSIPLPDHDLVENLETEFGKFFNDKVDAIRSTIDVTEPPMYPSESVLA